jgi:hypothetical protein
MELDTEGTYDDGKQTGIDGTMLYLYFKDATSIVAGRPYIVKWDEDTENTELKEPIFWDVTVSNAENVVSFPGGAFKGTYSPVTLAADDRSVLYVGTGTTLRWPTEDRTIGACRAYFELNEAGLAAREFVLNFDGEKTTTNISPAEIAEIAEMASAWYCLDGRKLQGKPTRKGVHVRNGKKIVVK